MANVMTRRFTLREKVLLGLLIVILLIGLYFFLVHYPIENRLEEIASERDEVEMQIEIAEAREKIYNDMQEELQDIFTQPADEITYMPKYDNIQVLMSKFNEIFLDLEPRMTFSSVIIENGIVTRPISFSFQAPSYEKAKEVLIELTGTGFRCLLSNITVSPSSGSIFSDSLTVSGTITFYELA